MKTFKELKENLLEKTLTKPELKKREEIAQAIEREHPEYSMSKKMAIATSKAKQVAKEYELDESFDIKDASTFGWNTSKKGDGYEWSVHAVKYQHPIKILHKGIESTRAKALAKAKKHVMHYRKGDHLKENDNTVDISFIDRILKKK